MAREKVVDLVVRQGSAQAVERSASFGSGDGGDLKRWAMRNPLPWGVTFVGGLVMVALGTSMAAFASWAFFGTMLLSSLLTAGSGLVFLSLVKRRGELDALTDGQRGLSASEHRVLSQRSKRISVLLAKAGRPLTYEALVDRTKWTRDAVLDTLLFMKERGEVAEDLDLDTGEWVYSASELEAVPGSPVSLMLEERRELSEQAENQG